MLPLWCSIASALSSKSVSVRVDARGSVLVPTRRVEGVSWIPARAAGRREALGAAGAGALGVAANLSLAPGVVAWAVRRPLDPGSPASCEAWLARGERGRVVYERDGVVVSDVRALDALGGSWRCLRTSRGRVVQSALRVVDGSLHPGALAGYTRALGATALAAAPRAPKRILNLGLGGGSVPNFLCAHTDADVLAVDVSRAVVAAARATVPPPEDRVSILVDDAARFAARAAREGATFDLAVIDVFDDASRPPPSLTTPDFAASVAALVSPSEGGVAMNLVGVTALGDESVQLDCAKAAREMVIAFERKGAFSLLTPADETQNAILWCLFDDDNNKKPPRHRRPPLHLLRALEAKRRAAARAALAGVQFDVLAELRGTVPVTSATIDARLAEVALRRGW